MVVEGFGRRIVTTTSLPSIGRLGVGDDRVAQA
jgi:hypothetical protein